MLCRIPLIDAHAPVPFVGDACQMRIEGSAESSDQTGQRVLEVTIFSFAEAVPRHVNVAAEIAFLRIERRDLPAFIGRHQLIHHRAAVAAEFCRQHVPVVLGDSRLDGASRERDTGDLGVCIHASASFASSARLTSKPQR